MRIDVISDIHIGSYGAKNEEFKTWLEELVTDWLILNGDIFELALNPPRQEIFDIIRDNVNIKKWSYIRGNHDSEIRLRESEQPMDIVSFEDVVVIHGHQYSADRFLSKPWVVKARYWIEKTFKINLKILLMKVSGPLIRWMLEKAQARAIEMYPTHKVVMGHTHLPKKDDDSSWYNCGGMVDSVCSYMTILTADGESQIILHGSDDETL